MRPWLILLLMSLLSGLTSCTDRESRKLETWVTHNGQFRIRVTSFADPGFMLASGAEYVFESSALNDEWKEIATVHHDIADPINRESVSFINDEVAFVRMRWMYAVTTDAGRNWSRWDSRKHKYLNNDTEWGVIETVVVGADGAGEMNLRVFPSIDSCQTLTTQDFGRTWVNGRLFRCL